MLADEIVQRREAGHLVAEPDRRDLLAADDDELRAAFMAVEASPRSPSWPYEEPAGLTAISAARAAPPRRVAPALDDDALLDRVQGEAWLGRCAVCMLGKPSSSQADDRRLPRALESDYPLVRLLPAARQGQHNSYEMQARTAEREGDPASRHQTTSRRDDDIDYTILGLHMLEDPRGGVQSATSVASGWTISRSPRVYTGERAAYRNLVIGLAPPERATHRNPYREWIGAQIRADMGGYVAAGDLSEGPGSRSRTHGSPHANRDPMALCGRRGYSSRARRPTTLARVEGLPRRSSRRGRGWPRRCTSCSKLRERGSTWEEARDRSSSEFGGLHSVHTVNNAASVDALLWGEGDYTARSAGCAGRVGRRVQGATAGSVFGALHGADGLPAHWVAPLNDRVASALLGFDGVRISELAARSLSVARAIRT